MDIDPLDIAPLDIHPLNIHPLDIHSLDIYQLSLFESNYVFLLHNPHSHQALVVDPGDTAPVLKALRILGAQLQAIFITHHDHDHVGGNLALLQAFPQAIVYGGAEDRGRIPGQQVFLAEGDRVDWGACLGLPAAQVKAEVWWVPGHTQGHIAYRVWGALCPKTLPRKPIAASGRSVGDRGSASSSASASASSSATSHLFSGDVLFGAGCGRIRGGKFGEMQRSLARIRQLPEETRIWCSHEYTQSNLLFAKTIDPDNRDLQLRIQQVAALRRTRQATVPLDLAEEKRSNPFLRWDDPAIQAAMGSWEAVETLTRLRQRKDLF